MRAHPEDTFTKRFLADVRTLFSGDHDAEMMAYFYSTPRSGDDPVRGLEYWQKFTEECDEYYIFRDEVRLISQRARDLGAALADRRSVIDLGPGARDAIVGKTLPVIAAAPSVSRYRAVDLSETHARQAGEAVKQAFPRVTIDPPSLVDFFDEKTRMTGQDDALVLLFGGSLFNMRLGRGQSLEERIRLFLRRLKEDFASGVLLITQDCNRDTDLMVRMYNHRQAMRCVSTVFHRIKRDLDTEGFDPGIFSPYARWSEDRNAIVFSARVNRDAGFRIETTPCHVREGDRLDVGVSYKFSYDAFRQLAQSAGLEPMDVLLSEEKRVALHVFRL